MPPTPEKSEKCVGIDVGILKYAHDSDGTAVDGPDLSTERERLEREQRKLSRKEHGSANYRKQQRVVARRHVNLTRKRRDFLHKLSNYYAQEVRSRGGRRPRRNGLDGTAAEQPQPGGSRVGYVPPDAQIQVRARRHALRRGRSTRDDEGMFGL